VNRKSFAIVKLEIFSNFSGRQAAELLKQEKKEKQNELQRHCPGRQHFKNTFSDLLHFCVPNTCQ
jgi:hypothetical protein